MEEVFRKVAKEEIYQATGIQFMPINTLYQLFAAQRQTPKLLDAAKYLLTIPDLFHYWLTGNAVCEFTNATTTQMVDPVKRTWAAGLMQRLELPVHLPAPIVEPGSIIGTLLPEIAQHSSLAGTTIIAPACSRHGFGGGRDIGSRWHSLYQFRNLVAGGHRTGFPCGHARRVAAELHQRRRREWNYETIEERDGTVDVAGLPEILDSARTLLRLRRID